MAELKPEDVIRIRYEQEWFEHEGLSKLAAAQHQKNLNACTKALTYHNQPDRPLEILILHGSGRDEEYSCAREVSTSRLFLEQAIKSIEGRKDFNIDRAILRQYTIEPCNNCVASSSALCGFPCDCFPFDGMQQLYPKILKADILLFSTGVNQSDCSSRIKLLEDRLISMDGGFMRQKFEPKTVEFKTRTMELAKDGNFEYAQRLFGRVCAYFISSKDHNNPHDEGTFPEGMKFGDFVATKLKHSFEDFGCFHAESFYAVAASKWDEEYMYDKARMVQNADAHAQAEKVLESAIELAYELKATPPKAEMGRLNRT